MRKKEIKILVVHESDNVEAMFHINFLPQINSIISLANIDFEKEIKNFEIKKMLEQTNVVEFKVVGITQNIDVYGKLQSIAVIVENFNKV